jgi:transmembrane sensor
VNDRIEAEALDWTIRVQGSEFADWESLTDWLQADPRHADTYKRFAAMDRASADLVRRMPPPSRPASRSTVTALPEPRSNRALSRPFQLMAASLLVATIAAAGWMMRTQFQRTPDPTLLALSTRPGETRSIRLPDGSQVTLASATSMSFDPRARLARLDRGRALFSVQHDPDHPFSVRLGDMTVTDVGTVFDLHRQGPLIDVGVSQGEVRVVSGDQAVAVPAGRSLHQRNDVLRVEPIDRSVVGSWRGGQFNYSDATVADVVADITAVTGASIRVSPGAASKRFAGIIQIEGDAQHALSAAAPVLGVEMARDGGSWIVRLPSNAAHR